MKDYPQQEEQETMRSKDTEFADIKLPGCLVCWGVNVTWQCYCGVGGFSAVDCRQYVRRDMPVTINCVLLSLHFHVLSTLLSL